MRALITGVTGQDGSYLAELLLEKGYEVYGMVRRIGHELPNRLSKSGKKIHLIEGDLTDQVSLDRMLQQVKPDEVYNLAGQTFVP
ncbi:MAG TPA: GDP-mannose 4,6-dehydratase, partial [Candidatus Angelobacter sp.]|nr:GDP-mannose 4,6-dehydratase [Candidatus Angelobacter sp.]